MPGKTLKLETLLALESAIFHIASAKLDLKDRADLEDCIELGNIEEYLKQFIQRRTGAQG